MKPEGGRRPAAGGESSHPDALPSDAPAPTAGPRPPTARFRRTLASVLAIQTAALLLLWLLQARYAR